MTPCVLVKIRRHSGKQANYGRGALQLDVCKLDRAGQLQTAGGPHASLRTSLRVVRIYTHNKKLVGGGRRN